MLSLLFQSTLVVWYSKFAWVDHHRARYYTRLKSKNSIVLCFRCPRKWKEYMSTTSRLAPLSVALQMRDNDFDVEVLINYYYLYYCNYYNSTMNFFLQMQNEMLYNYVGNCDVSKLNVGRKCCFSPKTKREF